MGPRHKRCWIVLCEEKIRLSHFLHALLVTGSIETRNLVRIFRF